MSKQLRSCVACKIERENCVQRRDGTWCCPPCIREAWEKTKRRLVYRSELVAITRKRFGKAQIAQITQIQSRVIRFFA